MTDSTHYDPVAVGERALAEVPVTVRAARAGGPGGQHVNTTDSAVTISVAVADLGSTMGRGSGSANACARASPRPACSRRARRTSAASTRTGASPASGSSA